MHKMMSEYQPPDVGMQLNRTQWKALFIINANVGKLTMSELSKIMNMEKGSVTSVVGGLIENGLIERDQNNEDRRKIFLTMTDKSREIVDKGVDAATCHIKQKMKVLSDDEIALLYDSLKNLQAIAEKI